MIAAEVTYWGVVLKMLLLGLSVFSCGVMLYRAIIADYRRHRPFLVTALLGVAGIVLAVAHQVLQRPVLDPSFVTYSYLVFLLAVGVGFLGDAVRNRRRDVEDYVFQQLEEDQYNSDGEEDKDA